MASEKVTAMIEEVKALTVLELSELKSICTIEKPTYLYRLGRQKCQ